MYRIVPYADCNTTAWSRLGSNHAFVNTVCGPVNVHRMATQYIHVRVRSSQNVRLSYVLSSTVKHHPEWDLRGFTVCRVMCRMFCYYY